MSGWDNGDSGGWRGRDSGGGGGRDRNGDSYRDRQANGGGGWRDEGSRPGQGRDGRGDNRYDSRGDRYPRDDNRGESRGGYGDRDRDRRSGGGRGGWNSGGGGGGGWDDQRGGGGQGWNDSANGWDDGGGRPKLSAPQQQQQAKASNGWSTNTNGGGGDGWSSVAGNGGGGNGWGDDWGAQGGGQGGGDAAAKPWWEQDNHEGGWEETHKGLKKFQDKWDSVVMLEQREQRRETEDRRENWPEERLEREGYMLTGLRAEHKGSMYGKSIIVFKFDHGRPIPFTKFATGDSAVMTRVSPAFMEGDADAGQGKHGKERKEVELTIMDKGAETLRALCDHLPKSLFGTWRLDKGENTVMFQRMDRAMREGLERVLPETLPEDPDVDACFEKEGGGKNAKPRELLFIGTTLHDVLFRPEEGGAQKPSGLFKDRFMKAAKNLLAGDSSNLPPYIAALNESQKRAIATALLHRVSLTQGPPGTGKTTTVVRLIALMRKEMGFKYPILACAQSNVAVDNLLEGLRDLDVQAVRVGQPVKVRDSLRDATVDAEMRSMDGWSELCSLENDLERKRRSEKKMNGGYERQLNEKLRNIKKGIIKGVLKKAEVICATCTGAGAEQLLGFSFPIVVLDEATQCAEPESVIPIAKGCRHLVLVGDHHQLPPVCVSEEAAAKGLGTSLFDRLMRLKRGDKPADAQPQQQQQFRRPRGKAYFPRPEVAGGSQEDRIVPAALLGIQYRMHSSISAFPCKHFYCGKLLDGTPDEKRPRPIFPWPVEGNQVRH
uniref:DNA2/NAM7 helicase helicase domain-containing protein n=1 Tax=Chromera velia CCMP2878 TaxID=1169474 RepID=A0A0G4H0C7_9ALVE|eukprot:Cvel_24081.t1-p1 / transcript=Cvel_24081.t1 / gene=Cvel_24081 / organism=Chromera_velia_CCMP2878 / gene_product=ATP-dependent helicase NAM7, putative / transcript_product=ATP-dependent helicase NAM7, putative / location=Cvel_scaffold2565:21512-26175(+) / protein_length=773 / sequence_SO=supercontig / SO=protein_coding / is_pseudo=false